MQTRKRNTHEDKLDWLSDAWYWTRNIKVPRDKTFKGIRLCAKNVERHFGIAQMLSAKRMYGPARSHLILAAEEAMKAMMVATVALGFTETEIDLGFVFGHKGRLALAAMLSIPFGFLEEIRLRAKKSVAPKQGLRRWAEGIEQKVKAGNPTPLVRFTEWWKQAGNYRNDGFYVDYRADLWKSPGRITKSAYLQALQKNERFIKMAISLKNFSPRYAEEMRNHFEEITGSS
jgi:AbiV family abortive infection protein